MERRTLLALFLAFLVLYAWQAFFVKPSPRPGSTTAAPAAAGARPAAAQSTATASPTAAAPPLPSPESGSSQPLVGESSERDIRVETRTVVAVFTNRGARLKSWRLKRYLDSQGQPQELVEQGLTNEPLPFTLRAGDAATTTALNSALFSVAAPPPGVIESPLDVQFEFRDTAGLRATKRFHFEPATYVVALTANVTSGDRPLPVAVLWGPAVGDAGETTRGSQANEALLYRNGAVERLASSSLATQGTQEGDFRYAGVDDTYFMSLAFEPGAAKITYQPVSIPPPAGSKDAARALVAYTVEPRQTGATLKFLVGPKDIDVLTPYGPEAVSAINFGRFAVIVVPLLRSLKWVNGYVNNWGWSIVTLTIILNILLFPLQQKSVVSMRKMQEIAPEIKSIQDRYSKLKATDPAKQKMNTEMMALYRERGVNPASGCVPLLLTLPILYAMWAMFTTAIELRGAPFLWIHNLTARDPLYITPVLMGATMFWQQRITPQTGDPAQQRMMMFMPIIMTVMFISLPAGALIYYVVSNLWRIGQQYATNYYMGPLVVRGQRSGEAERRMKRVGTGKTDAASGGKE